MCGGGRGQEAGGYEVGALQILSCQLPNPLSFPDASRIWKFLTSNHELVYEDGHGDKAMCKLLQALFRSFVITFEQMRAGFQRVYDQMVDISIDVTQAYSVLERWVLRCRQVTSYQIIC
jgi:hypothetical protein